MNMDLLVHSIEEHSLLWVVLSAGFGGLIGALIKFLFETVLALRYQQRITAKKMLRRYRFPLLRAADSLDRRIENFIRFANKKWYDDKHDEYYRVSTLYLFGAYLGWCKILEDSAYLEFEKSDRNAREFSIFFNRVFKGLTNFSYFVGLSEEEMDGVEAATVPRLALTAIGELMRTETDSSKDHAMKILGFVEFSQRLQNSPAFAKWFGYLENGILLNQQPSKSSASWNRLLVVATNLRGLIIFLDPKGRQTALRQIPFLNRMNPKVAKKIREELLEMRLEKYILP
jgi:hypothetical protein